MTPVHSLWILDVLDIFLVAALFYRLLILVKGTRSAQMYVGLLVIVLVGLLAREFDLIAVKWIVDSLKTVWLIAFVILFQPELRHALAQFGRTRYFRSFVRSDSFGVLGEIVRGVETLAERRHGALIVIERNVGLRNFIETGTRIDAKVSAELLVTLFSPGSPLHDGAVMVREESDAAVIVVSEQTGGISVCYRGTMKARLNEGELRSELSRIFRIRPEDENLSSGPGVEPPSGSGMGDSAGTGEGGAEQIAG